MVAYPRGCRLPLFYIESSDESVGIQQRQDPATCRPVLDLTTQGGAGGAMAMAIPVTRPAGTGSGNQDIPCLDDASGLPFRPKWVQFEEARDDANALQIGSNGTALLTDGTAPLDQIEQHTGLDVAGVRETLVHRGYLARLISIFNNAGWDAVVAAAPAATTLRVAWTQIGAGLQLVGILRIEGIP